MKTPRRQVVLLNLVLITLVAIVAIGLDANRFTRFATAGEPKCWREYTHLCPQNPPGCNSSTFPYCFINPLNDRHECKKTSGYYPFITDYLLSEPIAKGKGQAQETSDEPIPCTIEYVCNTPCIFNVPGNYWMCTWSPVSPNYVDWRTPHHIEGEDYEVF